MGQVDLQGRSQSSPMPWSKRLAFKDSLPPLRTLSLVRLRYRHPSWTPSFRVSPYSARQSVCTAHAPSKAGLSATPAVVQLVSDACHGLLLCKGIQSWR